MWLPEVKLHNIPRFPKIVTRVTWLQKEKIRKDYKDRLLGSLKVKTQNFPKIRSSSRSLEIIKQNFPRVFKIVMWGHQRSKTNLPTNSRDSHLRSPEIKRQNFQRIPNMVIYGHQRSKSRVSQEFPRSSFGLSRGQRWPEENLQEPFIFGVCLHYIAQKTGQRLFEKITFSTARNHKSFWLSAYKLLLEMFLITFQM